MKGIEYVNFIEIGCVDIEIRWVENSKLAFLVNNKLLRYTVFFAADQ